MDFTIIKKYIAAYLATPTTSLEEITTPKAGIKLTNGNEKSFFYLGEDENSFYEEYEQNRYLHTYDPETRAFKTINA